MNEELKVIITADIDQAKKALKDASDEVEDFGKESKETSKEVDKAFDDAGAAISSAMKVVAGVVAAGAVAIVGLAESTREYRTEQGKLITAFSSVGASAETARNVYSELNSVLGDSGVAVEAANHLARLTTNEQELAEWADICTGVYATFGDSLPIEGLTEAANETAKVGTVTGTLADALNWAGESEDEFNEKLSACVDEQEREKLIRETLTKVYKKASDQYKKTNKDIIASNKATDDINSTMAEMGETVEPVITEMKLFGASILKSLQKPLEKIVNFIVNDVIPTIEDITDWCKKNKPLIIGIITGVTTAMVAYKAATLAAKLAEEGITIATLARAAAQKVLNAAMAATPWGLVATLVTGAVAGLAAYAIAASDATDETDNLTNAEERTAEAAKERAQRIAEGTEILQKYKEGVIELTDAERASMEAAREAAEAYDEQREAVNKNNASTQSQMEYVSKLAEELLLLADNSGKVSEADQARADFIIQELNKALGTEYEMIDGVIQKYDELEGSIFEVINAKTASLLLENYNENYIKALENEKGAMDAVNNSYTDYHNQLDMSNEKIAEFKKQLKELEEEEDRLAEEGKHREAMVLSQRRNMIRMMLEDELEKVSEKEKAYQKDVENYAKYANDIETYESAMAESLKGNHDKAIEILTSKGEAVNDYGDEVDKATGRVLDTLYNEAIQAGIEAERTKQNFKDGVEGYTEDMVKEAEKAYADAMKEFEDAYTEANTVGEEFGNGLSDGLEKKRSSLVLKARNIVSSIWNAMRSEAEVKSPSRKTMKLGQEIDRGLEYGIDKNSKDVISSAKDMVSKTILPIEGVVSDISYKNIGGIFNNAALGMDTSKSSGSLKAGVADISSSHLMSQLAHLLGNSKTPIVLQVDGKVFAETAVSSINELTKQTGSLALNIM